MSRRILGLEIRNASIAAVLLDSGFKGSVLEAQGFFPIPTDNDEDEEGLKAVLKTIVEALKPAGAACVIGIPSDVVSFRNLVVPFSDTKKIRQILPFELEPTLPLPIEELSFAFEAIKRDGQQDLLAFAVQKSKIKHYVDLLESVNLRPVAIMPGGYAAARFISTLPDHGDDFLLIDTGEGNHAVYAVCSGNVRMVRTLPVASGGNPVLGNLQTAMQRTFTAVNENLGIDVNPMTVFTAGPQSQLLDAANGSSALMDAPIKPIDEIRSFSRLKGSLDTPDWESGHLDIALALALMETEAVDGINFSTARSTIQHYWSEYRSNIILTAALILLALVITLSVQFLSVNTKAQRVAELDRQIEMVFKSTFPDVTLVGNPLQQMQSKIKSIGDDSNGLDLIGTRIKVIDILNALSQQIPASVDVKVNRMVVGTDNVVLSGNTDTFNTVDDIKGRLEKADIFNRVTISSADLEKSGKRVRYKLKMDF